MFERLFHLCTIFRGRMTRKKSKYQIPPRITLNNLIPVDKRDTERRHKSSPLQES